jgi:hypothetical protein
VRPRLFTRAPRLVLEVVGTGDRAPEHLVALIVQIGPVPPTHELQGVVAASGAGVPQNDVVGPVPDQGVERGDRRQLGGGQHGQTAIDGRPGHRMQLLGGDVRIGMEVAAVVAEDGTTREFRTEALVLVDQVGLGRFLRKKRIAGRLTLEAVSRIVFTAKDRGSRPLPRRARARSSSPSEVTLRPLMRST